MDEVKAQIIKGKEIIKIGIILLAVVILSIIFIIVFGRDKTPKEDIVFDNILKTLTLDTYERVLTIQLTELEAGDLNNPETNLMLDVIKDIKLKLIHKYNKSSREVEGEIEVYLRDVRLLEGQLYISNDYLALEVPSLYNQAIYMTWSEFSKRYGINKEQIQLLSGNIQEKLSRNNFESFTEIEAEVYVNIIKDLLKKTLVNVDKNKILLDKEELSCVVYSFTMDEEDIKVYTNDFIEAVLTDIKLDKLMERQRLEFLFDQDSYNEFEKKNPYNAIIDSTVYFDKHDILRKATINIQAETNGIFETPISGNLIIDTEYVKLENISFDRIDIKKAVDISKLNSKEIAALSTDMRNNFIKNMEKNRLYDLLILD